LFQERHRSHNFIAAKASTTSTSPSAAIDYKAAIEAAPRTGNGVYGAITWFAVVFGAVLFI